MDEGFLKFLAAIVFTLLALIGFVTVLRNWRSWLSYCIEDSPVESPEDEKPNRCRHIAGAILALAFAATAQAQLSDRASLGNKIFHDPRFSLNAKMSCASCHEPEHGNGDGLQLANGLDGNVAILGQKARLVSLNQQLQRNERRGPFKGKRRTIPFKNLNAETPKFYDFRAANLRDQVLMPFTNELEMALPSREELLRRVGSIPGYRKLFAEAYGTQGISQSTVADSLVEYCTAVRSEDTPIDRYRRGETDAMSRAEIRGWGHFNTMKCTACHDPDNNFRNDKCHNVGSVANIFERDPKKQERGLAGYTSKSTSRFAFNITHERAFAVPCLYECALSAPYFHDGSRDSIEEVLRFHVLQGGYRDSRGAPYDTLQDPRIIPHEMSAGDFQDLVAFHKISLHDPLWPRYATKPELPQ